MNTINASPILALFHQIRPLCSSFQERLLACLKEDRFPRKHLLLEAGKISDRVYFITKGFAKCFAIDYEGRERVRWFMRTGDLMISVKSFFLQVPSKENIELLQDCILQSITWNELQTLSAEFPEFIYHREFLTTRYYIQAVERQELQTEFSAEERYEKLRKEDPDLIRIARLQDIASFLNMGRQHISRIRGKR